MCTEFHLNRSRNVERMGRNTFTALSNVSLSLGRFSRNSRFLDKLAKNNYTEFHEKRQAVQPLLLHVTKNNQQPLFMKRITRNTEHSCADDDSSFGVTGVSEQPDTSNFRATQCTKRHTHSKVHAVSCDQDGTIHNNSTSMLLSDRRKRTTSHCQQRSTAWRT